MGRDSWLEDMKSDISSVVYKAVDTKQIKARMICPQLFLKTQNGYSSIAHITMNTESPYDGCVSELKG